jgi:hypothetical protein
VAPVVAGPGGFEKVDVSDPAAVVTGADGRAQIEFDAPGWHRIKAQVSGAGGKETAVRSNRLDVCVFALLPSECPPPPGDDLVRTPPPIDPGDEGPASPAGGASAGGGGPVGRSPSAPTPPMMHGGRVRLRAPRLDRGRLGQGLVRVSWRVLDPGVGIAKWTISSRALGDEGAPYLRRASGRAASSAVLRLSRGATYRLRLTVTDILGRAAIFAIGQVQVPR